MNGYCDQYILPNGQLIYHKNNYETDYVFNEIFNNNIYLQHGININDNAIIFDIGANIGLFSLYIKQHYPSSKIYAFEPAPDTYAILDLNLASLGNSIKTYNIGLSDDNKESVFHYYPDFTVISGFHANQERDAEIITSGIQCNNHHEIASVTQLINKRLEKLISYKCQVKTLSKIIEQEHIMEIDLLKLDVEGSELAILKGIAVKDWVKVKQIVMEVHHKNDLEMIYDLLKNKLFIITVEADERLKNAGIYNLYARR
jgi:FkbM family methyltransferase